jgi:predicted porin
MTFKRKHIGCAVAAALCLGATGAALAQSNTTLYGRVVGGVEYVDKIADPTTGQVGSLTRAAGNHWGTSLFGFKGTEDLGGGLKAIFVLESGFSSTNGTTNGSALFNRRSYVGLSSTDWGTLQVGKNLLNSDLLWSIDPTGKQFVGSATLVRGRNWPGADNVVEYTTPNWGGFTANAQLSMGEQPGSFNKRRAEGLSLAYAADALELRAIYTGRRDANGNFSDVYSASKETTVGGTYRIGNAKLFAAYDYITAPDSAVGVPTRLRHGWLGVRYDLSPALTLIGAAYRVSGNNNAGNATLLMAGADYYLSKRTFLYATVGGVNNSSTANYAADVTVNGPGAGKAQRVFYTGIGHVF